MTDWITKKNTAAAARVREILDRPLPNDFSCRSSEEFDPWDIFPALYGSYSDDFDACAIDVLSELLNRDLRREDLAAEMLREMLCTQNLCEYGTSPRSCWPTAEFQPLIPELLEKWKAWSAASWAE